MKKYCLLLIMAAVLFATLQSVSAYASYNYDPYYGAEVYLSFKNEKPACYGYDYCDNQRSRYRPRYYGYNPYNDDEFWEYYNKRRTVAWLDNSFHDRYSNVAGRTSGNVFCQGCKNNAGYGYGDRKAYDYRDGGRGSYARGNYYDVQWDQDLGYYNWRY
jgi:hypothetical protein